jgi:hypothetical protein
MRGAREAGWGGLLPRLLSVDEDAFGATISYWIITPYPPLHTSFRTQMAYLYMNGRPCWSYWSLPPTWLTANYFIQTVNDERQFFIGCFC